MIDSCSTFSFAASLLLTEAKEPDTSGFNITYTSSPYRVFILYSLLLSGLLHHHLQAVYDTGSSKQSHDESKHLCEICTLKSLNNS